MSVQDLNHAEALYAIAIERADYRRAVWIAVGRLRRAKANKAERAVWSRRLCGSMKLRSVA